MVRTIVQSVVGFGMVVAVLSLGTGIARAQEETVELTEEAVQISTESKPILYVQEGCNYCEEVEDFIADNGLEAEVIVKDIFVDEKASEELDEFMEENGVPLEQRGVPVMVYGESGWAIGDEQIIDYIAERHDVEVPEEESKDPNMMILVIGGAFLVVILGYGIFQFINGRKEG